MMIIRSVIRKRQPGVLLIRDRNFYHIAIAQLMLIPQLYFTGNLDNHPRMPRDRH
jgi:hypothetical protein